MSFPASDDIVNCVFPGNARVAELLKNSLNVVVRPGWMSSSTDAGRSTPRFTTPT